MKVPPALALAGPVHRATPPPVRVGVLALGGLGGSSRVASDLAHGLARAGHHATLLSSPDPWWKPASATGVPLASLPVPREPTPAHGDWVQPLADALVSATLEHELRVLSVHYGVGLVHAAVMARRRLRARGWRLQVCATLHGTDVTHWGRSPEQGPALARAVRACDAVTAVSGWLADRAHHTLALPRRPEVIANGVDTALFRPGPARALPLRPRLCHASNFRPVKRPLDAIDVLARLRDRGRDAELLMVGQGPLHARAQAHARDLGLGSRVRFLSAMPPARLAALLRTVDLSLVTSASESFGLFALESMACGAPVLGTRCGGLQEVFGADRSGVLSRELLADVGDVDELARRADAVLGHPRRLAGLRQRALALGRHAFPREQQLQRFEHLLGRLTTEAAA